MHSYTATVVTGSALAGAGSSLWGVFYAQDGPLSHLGSVAVVVGALVVMSAVQQRSIHRSNRPSEVAFDEGYEMGYDRGYTEGRRIGAPTVVRFPARSVASGDS